ncbi:adenylosuccinate lyase [Pollutibacter soli]|uniref:adenylosuccinate lyase n=1 Tax=Pollutibacter soli TaxID=3034157 RepID=UPI0030138C4D
MDLSALTAISPADGRYRNQLQQLAEYFSEFALIRYRVRIEIEYFIALSSKKFFSLKPAQVKSLRDLYLSFTPERAQEIKNVERITNHDVKAVEYFIKKELDALKLSALKEWVHFGLTSQDINNTAIPLLWKESLENEYFPGISNLAMEIRKLATQWLNIPMLARTHGQPASPTRLGKEMMVFAERLDQQLRLMHEIPYSCKFGGATGNFNAHVVAFPNINWINFANTFCEDSLGLQRQQFTTQIEHYDYLAAHFDAMKRINTILIDYCRDIWTYISMDYFKQKIKKGEVGSSAMPHKVNPIDFENAEGNLGFANAIFSHLSEKLPVSRLQRDLTDSTVLRNLGVPFAHTILSFKSIEKGQTKLVLNESAIHEDLDNNWAVVAEAIQTILRRENYPQPYEALKDLTRGNAQITKENIHEFIGSLKISSKVKKELKAITPFNYTGVVQKF